MTTLQIASIVIGERVRKDMGDIESLAADIKKRGLLQPIGVTANGELIYGGRRLEAMRLLGFEKIAVTVHDIEDRLGAERAENMERKDLTPTEAVAIGLLIEEQHRPEALARIRAGKQPSGESPQGRLGVADMAAELVGMARQKYTQAKAVVAAAEADPEKFGDLPAQMDETGNVSGTHNELKRRKGANGKNDKKLRHAVHSRARYPKPNREIQRAIDSMDGICICLNELPLNQLDPQKTKAWGAALKKSASIIARIAREVSNVKS